ncbi:hypothetical protein [Mumia sp. Pv 4-285]|uniref:hypothetical protein n=1 Tax=Mumia qirimensis TaxID=3234852 RepID=UPI00351D2426
MDILRPGGTFWRIAPRRRSDFGEPLPWMAELAGAATGPPARSDLGRRPIVVTCDGVVVHVEPAPGRRGTDRRIQEIAAALYALPTKNHPSHEPYRPGPGPGTTGGWGVPGQGGGWTDNGLSAS